MLRNTEWQMLLTTAESGIQFEADCNCRYLLQCEFDPFDAEGREKMGGRGGFALWTLCQTSLV